LFNTPLAENTAAAKTILPTTLLVAAGDKVISILDSLPKEFELEKYIDYDTQFEKAFVEPLKGVLDVIGWDTERRSSLNDFFV
jgi:hypothetical protein